ncbi:Putative galacturonosyltransferase-like 7 [Glycine soja]|nr:Putative galacturonosyltransferase-like 7 [Glycine soja]
MTPTVNAPPSFPPPSATPPSSTWPSPLTWSTYAAPSPPSTILQHSQCLKNIFHFLVCETNLESLVKSTFPQLNFKVYYFDPEIVRNLISTSVRQTLEQPLNYVSNYLTDLLEPYVERVIYLDSDLVLVDDILNFKILEFSLYRQNSEFQNFN